MCINANNLANMADKITNVGILIIPVVSALIFGYQYFYPTQHEHPADTSSLVGINSIDTINLD